MIQGLCFGSNHSVTLAENEISWLYVTPPTQNSDEYYDKVVTNYDVGGFVIEFSGAENSKSALQLATHLRFLGLTQGITIVGKISKEDFYLENLNSLLNTNLVNFENLDELEDNKILKLGYSISFQDFKDAIKKGPLIIPKPDNSSNHAISNEWGAFKLAYATNTLNKLEKNVSVQEKKKTLYFKYLCLKENIEIIENSVPKTIDCKNRRVLLIDDQAEKGWEDIFKTILQPCHFEAVPISYELNSKVKDENKIFSDAQKKIEEGWDIVLLDLRLKSTDRENIASFNDIKQFSGYQLLKEIKEKNKGTQVIIFTASNKAWNMKALLEAGADGYYIKESPDFQYEENYAQENFEAFQKDMEKAVGKAGFLKCFWKNTTDLISHTETEYVRIGTDFINSVKLSLEYAYDTIANYHSQNIGNQKFLNYTFVSYCNLIEFVIRSLEDGNNFKETQSYGTKQVIFVNNQYQSYLNFKRKELNPNDNKTVLIPAHYTKSTTLVGAKVDFVDRNSW